MVWLTWRQHRMQLVVTVALLAAAGLALMMDALPEDVVKMLPWAPVLIGLFWGVPLLVREYERGTYRVVWTQTVTRRRWLLVKFGVLGLAVAVAGLAFGVVVSAWVAAETDEPYLTRFSGDLFGQTGVAPVGWFLFLFALGAAAGSALRRTLPAMAVTMAVFVAVMFALPVVRGGLRGARTGRRVGPVLSLGRDGRRQRRAERGRRHGQLGRHQLGVRRCRRGGLYGGQGLRPAVRVLPPDEPLLAVPVDGDRAAGGGRGGVGGRAARTW